jgi:hypothetical protein
MIAPFTFEEGGRTYTCAPEKGQTPPAGTWWWFTVSSDSQRYAPFEAVSGDTQASIRTRIVAYYERRLWARAQPAVQRNHFGRPGKPATVQAKPAGPDRAQTKS